MSQVYEEIYAEAGTEAQSDSALQHLMHMMEGYRERIRNVHQVCPYSPGSARAVSYFVGVTMALQDLREARVVKSSSEER